MNLKLEFVVEFNPTFEAKVTPKTVGQISRENQILEVLSRVLGGQTMELIEKSNIPLVINRVVSVKLIDAEKDTLLDQIA